MKTNNPQFPSGIRKHLSPGEQKKLDQFKRHRSDQPSETKHATSVSKRAGHALLLIACAAGILAGGGTTLRADEPHAVSVPGLFNEANAAQREGRLGPAILNYERASFLAPGDPSIARNLHAAREKAGVPAPVIPMWQSPMHWLSFNRMTALGSLSLLMVCLLHFGARMIPANLRGFARAATKSFAIMSLLAAFSVAMRCPELDRAIIVGTHTSARIAPAASSATTFELKPGEMVRAKNTHGGFIHIRTTDGRSGWVSATDVEKIIPAAS
ncbi:MAG: hypothetical protein RL693_1011 [Verrucomicrobiota bacterium]|jgi:hypothetical protein